MKELDDQSGLKTKDIRAAQAQDAFFRTNRKLLKKYMQRFAKKSWSGEESKADFDGKKKRTVTVVRPIKFDERM